jgi:hypothetical protein
MVSLSPHAIDLFPVAGGHYRPSGARTDIEQIAAMVRLSARQSVKPFPRRWALHG